jgi:hypothetical protein
MLNTMAVSLDLMVDFQPSKISIVNESSIVDDLDISNASSIFNLQSSIQ